jgi:hypothetical protein
MRKTAISVGTAIVVALSGANISFAQDGAPPNITPVEMQACSYKDRKDRDDLDSAMNRMVTWMEEENSPPYSAWILEKLYTGADRTFDYLYVGAWPDGSVMGQDITQYRATAGDEIEAAAEVSDCPANLLYGSLNTKEPPEGDLARDGVVITMTDCKVAEGRKVPDAIAAIREYGEYRAANGSPGGTWVWFPIYGGGADGDANFKILNSHTDIQAFGNFYKWNIDNASYRKRNELSEGLLSCDTARAYLADSVVNTMTPSD